MNAFLQSFFFFPLPRIFCCGIPRWVVSDSPNKVLVPCRMQPRPTYRRWLYATASVMHFVVGDRVRPTAPHQSNSVGNSSRQSTLRCTDRQHQNIKIYCDIRAKCPYLEKVSGNRTNVSSIVLSRSGKASCQALWIMGSRMEPRKSEGFDRFAFPRNSC